MKQKQDVNLVGFTGLYSIDDTGNVYSNRTNKLLKHIKNSQGYHYVVLCNNKNRKQISVHRLVAMEFIPNVDFTKIEVNHKDGNKSNNSVYNLEWVTPSENTKHSYATGLRKRMYSSKNGNSKHVLDLQTGIYYSSKVEASEAKGLKVNNLRSLTKTSLLVLR